MTFGGGFAPTLPPPVPPVDFSGREVLGPPAPPTVVDRQLYLQQQQELIRQQQERMRQEEALRIIERNRQMQIAQGLAGVQGLEAGARQAVEGAEPWRAFGFESHRQAVVAASKPRNRDELERALAYRDRGGGQGLLETIQQNPLYRAARTAIPEQVREPIVQGVSGALQSQIQGGPLGMAAQQVTERIPGIEKFTEPIGNVQERIAKEAGELLVPREIWDTALTLIPAAKARTIPELLAAVSLGDADALSAVKRAGARLADNEIIAAAGRALRSESGQTTPENALLRVPDAVKAIVTRRRGPKVPIKTEEELQAAWEVLPPENKKFITVVAESIIPDSERKARLAASRGRKAGSIGNILEGEGSASEKLDAAWRARRGADLPSQQPLRGYFDEAEIESYKQQIIDAARNKTISVHEAANLDSSLRLILDGARKNGTTNPLMPHERSLFARVFGPEWEAALPKNAEELTTLQKILAPFHVWRSLRSGFDNSALGRQGRKVMFSDPAEWLRAIGPNLKAMKSQKGYDEVMEVIRRDEFYDLGQSIERPLAIVEQGSGLADEWLSPITKHIPLLRASERAYLGFLNAVRQSVFSKNMRALVKAWDGDLNNVPMESIQQVIDNINNATMFGNISKAGDWSRALGQTFFSIRGNVAGPQYWADFVRIALNPNADPAVRKIVAKRFAAYIGSSVTTLMAANQMGYWLNEKTDLPVFVGTELNPWSQSFGEMRVGPTKFNPWGNEIVLVRAALQWASARQLSEGEQDPHKVSRNEIAARVIRNKLSPGASVFFDLTFNKGRDYQGRPIVNRQWQYAIEQSSPLFWWDVQDSMKEQGWWGLADIGQFFGADVQTYGPNERTQEKVADAEFQKKLSEAGYPDRDQTYASNKDFRNGVAEAFSVPADNLPATWDEFREGMIKRAVQEGGLTEAEATYRFDNHAFNNNIETKLKVARLDFWQENPQLLKEAIEKGETDWSQEKEKILEDAGLR